MEREKFNIDAIVVGAGPAGVSAALALKRGGKNVVVIERSDKAGTKNMFGGAVYLNSVKSIFPNSFNSAPYERFMVHRTYSFLNDSGSCDIKASNFSDNTAAAVMRPKFDSWMIEEAKKEGVYFAPKTLVKKLIYKNGSVVGVKTEQEKYFAPVVILADGVNSLLSKDIGLRKEFFPKDMVLSVKETYKLDKKTLEERFNLEPDSMEGAMYEFFGGLSGFYAADKKKKHPVTPFAIGFLYTFKDTISLGLGISLEDLTKYKLKPYEVLEKFKSHPAVKRLIAGGEMNEYSAHMIPEFGYNHLPKLYANGVMIAGDAAGLINSAHFEGTNFAIESGRLAGETAVIALNLGKYNHNILKTYEEKLRKSFVLKDMKSYRNVVETLYLRKNSILKYYPDKMGEFFEMLHVVDNVDKKRKFTKFFRKIFFEKSIVELFRDFKAFLKLFFEIIF